MHKHRVPREPTQAEEGREVRAGSLGKLTSQQGPVAHGGPGQGKPKLVAYSRPENQVETCVWEVDGLWPDARGLEGEQERDTGEGGRGQVMRA